jgi:hypothetical protein
MQLETCQKVIKILIVSQHSVSETDEMSLTFVVRDNC